VKKLQLTNKSLLSDANSKQQRPPTTDRAGMSSVYVFPLVYCAVDNMLFEVSPEICCSGTSSHYCCYRNYAAGSNRI